MANIAKIILPKLFQQNNFNRINLVCSPESPLVYQRPYYRGLVHQKAVIRTKGIIQSTWYRREASRVPTTLFRALGTAERLLVYQSLQTFTDRHPQGRKIKWQILVTCKICHLPFFCPHCQQLFMQFWLTSATDGKVFNHRDIRRTSPF